MEYLVDSNVLIDIADVNAAWFDWSSGIVHDYMNRHVLIINPVVFSEISISYARIEQVDAFLGDNFIREAVPWEAAFLAGKIFMQYRKRGGTKTAPLPDFFIGAHADVTGRALITRDPRRYRHNFPKLQLVCPDTH